MASRETENAFLGRGWAFPPQFDARTGAAVMRDGAQDVAESLWILFRTRPGERVMHPDFGCRLADFVFEPKNSRTRAGIEVAITRAIRFFEARIILREVSVDMGEWEDGKLRIHVSYTLRATNSRHNMVFPFYVDEGTLLSDPPRPEAG